MTLTFDQQVEVKVLEAEIALAATQIRASLDARDALQSRINALMNDNRERQTRINAIYREATAS